MDCFNRQVCFNELSSLDNKDNEDAILLFSNYAKTIAELKNKGFNGVRYDEKGIFSLNKEGIRNIYDLINDPTSKTLFRFILSTGK